MTVELLFKLLALLIVVAFAIVVILHMADEPRNPND